jgi:hypothetical protein
MSIESDITGQNYSEKVKAFMVANGGTGFLLRRRSEITELARYWLKDEPDWKYSTPRQWGAWLAYLKRLHKAISFHSRDYVTVPSEWPHEFDSGTTVQGDHAAADAYERQQAAEKTAWVDAARASAEHRKAVVATRMRNFQRCPKPSNEPGQPEKQPFTISKEELAASRDRIKAETRLGRVENMREFYGIFDDDEELADDMDDMEGFG